MTIEFTDGLYRFTWGKAPRGNGLWFFKADSGLELQTYGTLTEAKRTARSWARKAFQGREYVEIEIEP